MGKGELWRRPLFPYPNGVGSNLPSIQVQSYLAQQPYQPAALANQVPGQQIALANTTPAFDPDKPVLIKKFGVEVEPITGGKVKITGVMGNSWAEKAGLKVGDILLFFLMRRRSRILANSRPGHKSSP